MDEQRYHEILPTAYMTAALKMGGKPSLFEVGLCARDIASAEWEKSPAYRIAMAVPIRAEILSVTFEKTKFDAGYFNIHYRELATKEHEEKDIKTLLLTDRLFGRVTNAIWNRYDDDGKNQWVGKHLMLYKHNDPPKEGDRSKNGYRRVVYAEPLD